MAGPPATPRPFPRLEGRDLQRRAAMSAGEQGSEQSADDAGGVHWMDRFGGPTTIAATGAELCLAMQA